MTNTSKTLLLMGAATFLALTPLISSAEPKKIKPFDIPANGFFLDLVGPDKSIKTDDDADMALRFAPGPRNAPRNAMVMNSPELQDWVDSMNDIVARYTEVYNLGAKPAPYTLPIYIITDHDINCLVVREDAEEAGKSEDKGMFGFLDTTAKPTTLTTPTPGNPLGTTSAPDTPSRVEMRCTHDALVQIGGSTVAGQSDDGRSEIAFVLAHEFSHVLLGHFKLAEAQAKKQKDLTTLLSIGVTIATLANSNYRRSGNTLYVEPTAQASKDSTKALIAAYFLNDLNVAILGPKYAREQERQADFMAVDLMHQAGGNLNMKASTNVLGKWAAEEKKLKAEQPSFAQQLATALASSALVQVSNGQSGKGLINSLATQATILAYKHWRDGAVARVHDDSDTRVAAIADYIKTHYEKSGPDLSKLRDDGDSPELASTEASADIHYPSETKLRGFNPWDGASFSAATLPLIQAEKLLKEMHEGTCDKLTAESQAFVTSELAKTERSQVENFAMGTYLNCQQKWNEAVPYLADAAHGPQKRAEYYLPYIDILQRTGQFELSLKAVDDAETQAPKKQAYILPRIASLVSLDRAEEAEQKALACKASQDMDLGTRCMAAIGKTYDGQPLPKADASSAPPDENGAKSFLTGLLGGKDSKPQDSSDENK